MRRPPSRRPRRHAVPPMLLSTLGLLGLATFLPSLAAAQAEPIGGEIAVNVETLDDQDTATVAAAPDGTFVVVWESFGQDGSGNGVYLRRIGADGSPLGGDVLVNVETASEQEDADVAFLAGGGFVVVWDADGQDGDQRGIFGRLFDAAGLPVSGEIAINATTDGDQNDPVVAPAIDGGFLVVWETQGAADPFEDLVARRFDADGLPAGGEVAVNVFTDDDQEDADVAADAAGGFVVAWESEGQDGDLDSVVTRRFDADGQPIGGEIAVNTFTLGDQDDPDLAVHDDGSFVVVWEDDTQDFGLDAVYARYFAADGQPAGDPFKVDTWPGREMNPRVALDARGGAVVAWDSLQQDGSGLGVRLRHFDLEGTPRGAEQAVNVTTAGDQLSPHLAIGADARGLAVWESLGDQDGSLAGVFARRFSVPIFWDGFETGDLAAWSSTVP